jgi:hypothetical protein
MGTSHVGTPYTDAQIVSRPDIKGKTEMKPSSPICRCSFTANNQQKRMTSGYQHIGHRDGGRTCLHKHRRVGLVSRNAKGFRRGGQLPL